MSGTAVVGAFGRPEGEILRAVASRDFKPPSQG
jgi:hypothetical protein